jgi:hypothetical protein
VSRYAINRNTWSPSDKDEYEDLLAEICNETTTTRASVSTSSRDKLIDAINAQRQWALDVSSASRRAGLGKEITRFEDRNRVLVSHNGELLSVPRTQSRKVKVAGEVTYQRELIVVWTWDEIAEKREDVIKASPRIHGEGPAVRPPARAARARTVRCVARPRPPTCSGSTSTSTSAALKPRRPLARGPDPRHKDSASLHALADSSETPTKGTLVDLHLERKDQENKTPVLGHDDGPRLLITPPSAVTTGPTGWC